MYAVFDGLGATMAECSPFFFFACSPLAALTAHQQNVARRFPQATTTTPTLSPSTTTQTLPLSASPSLAAAAPNLTTSSSPPTTSERRQRRADRLYAMTRTACMPWRGPQPIAPSIAPRSAYVFCAEGHHKEGDDITIVDIESGEHKKRFNNCGKEKEAVSNGFAVLAATARSLGCTGARRRRHTLFPASTFHMITPFASVPQLSAVCMLADKKHFVVCAKSSRAIRVIKADDGTKVCALFLLSFGFTLMQNHCRRTPSSTHAMVAPARSSRWQRLARRSPSFTMSRAPRRSPRAPAPLSAASTATERACRKFSPSKAGHVRWPPIELRRKSIKGGGKRFWLASSDPGAT